MLIFADGTPGKRHLRWLTFAEYAKWFFVHPPLSPFCVSWVGAVMHHQPAGGATDRSLTKAGNQLLRGNYVQYIVINLAAGGRAVKEFTQ